MSLLENVHIAVAITGSRLCVIPPFASSAVLAHLRTGWLGYRIMGLWGLYQTQSLGRREPHAMLLTPIIQPQAGQ
jgi:hypothetical protein